MSEIILRYASDDELWSGSIVLKGDSSVEDALGSFDGLTFSSMMGRFAEALLEEPEAQAVMIRTDRPGPPTFVLDPQVADLLRSDPIAAVRMMSPPPLVIDLRQQATSPIPTGYSVLVSAFGDSIYAKAKPSMQMDYATFEYNFSIECPGCGRWAKGFKEFADVFICPNCRLSVHIHIIGRHWAKFRTEELLRTPFERFFFPRPWNRNPPWISRQDLQSLLSTYLTEKLNAAG